MSIDEELVDDLVERGCELSDAGDHLGALECFLVAADAGSADGAFDAGNEYRKLGRRDEARAMWILATDRGQIDAWYNLGLLLEELGDDAGALAAFRQAAEHGDSKGLMAEAINLHVAGRWKRARRLMKKARRDKRERDFVDAITAAWDWEAHRDVTLEPALRRAVELYPSAVAELGELLVATDRVDEAERLLDEACRNGNYDACLPLGLLREQVLHDLDGAEDAYRRGIALGDGHSVDNLAILQEERRAAGSGGGAGAKDEGR